MTPEQHLNNVCRGFLRRGATQDETLKMRAWVAKKQFKRAKCRYCRIALSGVSWSLDHQIPLSRGGCNDLSNLVLCCKRCNRAKGNMSGCEFLLLLELLEENFIKTVADSIVRRLAASGFMYRRS